uniref:Uncharacterized protein n=1 Tax=Babesia duncani TaxID=323732 RepID=A0A385GNG8_9APIC|nr:hypothetical protein [Babesia duncani]
MNLYCTKKGLIKFILLFIKIVLINYLLLGKPIIGKKYLSTYIIEIYKLYEAPINICISITLLTILSTNYIFFYYTTYITYFKIMVYFSAYIRKLILSISKYKFR